MTVRSNWSLVGIPDHEGVINIGGRIGATRGPEAFRKAFRRLADWEEVRSRCVDRGDLGALSQNVRQNLDAATALVHRAHLETEQSVVVGGGHDHGYSHFRGVLTALREKNPDIKVGCINIDAHLDVRAPEPKIMSGSPFYLAVEEGHLDPQRFVEFGIQRHCNSADLWKFIEKHQIRVHPFDSCRNGQALPQFQLSLDQLSQNCDAIVLSLDLDALSEAFAPGVSAPQAEGFSASEIFQMMEVAGSHAQVCSLGIFELNPEHDRDDQTARIAAGAAYRFIAGPWHPTTD